MFVLGVDIGYSNLKLAVSQSGSEPKTIIHLAGCRSCGSYAGAVSVENDDDTCLYVSVDNERWAAGVPAGRLQGWERRASQVSHHKTYKGPFSYRLVNKTETESHRFGFVTFWITGFPVSRATT